ncbi:hypothetical protein [Streptomyces violaceusniger]|uniref:hypothetical protein n=1 Tax=Streptomyces violaceusniger TaxID=68280 RepID=UPI003828604A
MHWWDDDAAPELQRKAREACLSCPVFAECLKDATAGEAGYDYGRSQMQAGLTGRQRDWLYRHSRKYGPYDAEEARLLALEAKVSGRKVEEIAAREGATGPTVRLAARLLADPEVGPVQTVGEKVQQRMNEVLEWRDQGLSLDAIAALLDVSRRKLTQVMKEYLESDDATRRRGPRRLSDEDAIVLAARRARGVSWNEMDVEEGLAPGTMLQRVCRWRRDAEQRGVPIPSALEREQNKLTQAQVVRMRERAAEGVTDVEQAAELGISRQQVTRIVSGESYRHFGGPIRAKRDGRPRKESRMEWLRSNGGEAGLAKAV